MIILYFIGLAVCCYFIYFFAKMIKTDKIKKQKAFEEEKIRQLKKEQEEREQKERKEREEKELDERLNKMSFQNTPLFKTLLIRNISVNMQTEISRCKIGDVVYLDNYHLDEKGLYCLVRRNNGYTPGEIGFVPAQYNDALSVKGLYSYNYFKCVITNIKKNNVNLNVEVAIYKKVDKSEIKEKIKLEKVEETTTPIVIEEQQEKPQVEETSTNNAEISTITVIDFETANDKYNSACSIGISVIENGKIIENKEFLIQPPNNYYFDINIGIHGITPEMTKDVPLFPAVWEQIKCYFNNTYIAAHNAIFDMSVLKATLEHYNLPQPNFTYINTLYICDKALQGVEHTRKLDDLCSLAGIEMEKHHNAGCDAKATAELILFAFSKSRYVKFDKYTNYLLCQYSKEFCDVKVKKTVASFGNHQNVNIKKIRENTSANAEKDADFDGKAFVFTGELEKYTREEAMKIVIERGGTIKSGVSNSVDILVNTNKKPTSKVIKALELQKAGHPIKIIDESVFLRMLEDNNKIDI